MKRLVVLCGETCGYCKKAKMLIKRALEKEPKYCALDIRFVNEDSEEGEKMPHTLVPAVYCEGALVFEGNPSMEVVASILGQCYG